MQDAEIASQETEARLSLAAAREAQITAEKAREHARRKFDDFSTIDWKVIAVDTRQRLVPSAEVLAHDLAQHS